MSEEICAAIVVTAFIFGYGGATIAGYKERNRWLEETVKRGKAEWILNKETGNVTWKWKE